MGRMIHMSVHKRIMLEWVEHYGPEVLEPQPASKEEALRLLREDPREWFSGCPDALPDGKCPGHPADELPPF